MEQKVIAKPDITTIVCTNKDWVVVACDGMVLHFYARTFTHLWAVPFAKVRPGIDRSQAPLACGTYEVEMATEML